MENNLPTRQKLQPRQQVITESYVNDILGPSFKRRMQETIATPEKIRVGVDLFTGYGFMVAGQLGAFPNADIHTVDFYENSLAQILAANPRVIPHIGMVIDVLKSGAIPKADFVSISDANQLHGFTAENIHLLVDLVRGHLLTRGDNGGLEENSWFTDAFRVVQIVKALDFDDGALWVRK